MDRNLHKLDDIFNSAYQRYEEDPSDSSWDKVNYVLDKQDAVNYKKRLIGWKRTAILMCALLSGLIIRDSGIFNKAKQQDSLAVVKKLNTTVADNTLTDNSKLQTRREYRLEDSVVNVSNSILDKHMLNPVNSNVMEVANTNNFNDGSDVKTTGVSNFKHNSQIEKNQVSGILYKKTSDKINNDAFAGENLVDANVDENDLETSGFEIHAFAGLNNGGNVEDLAVEETIINSSKKIWKDILISNYIPTIIQPNLNPDSFITNSIVNLSGLKLSSGMFKPFVCLSLFVSNDFARYMLDNDVENNAGMNDNEKEAINGRERHEASFSGGLLFNYQYKKHIGIKTGLTYSNTAIAIDPQMMYASKNLDGQVAFKYVTSSGYGYVKPEPGAAPAVGDSIQSPTTQHNLESIGIPLMVTYKIARKKLSINPSAGIATNLITRASIKTEVKNASGREAVNIDRLNGMRNFYLAFIADVNIQYNFNNRLAANLLPSFKCAVSPITKSNAVRTFPYSFGIGAGITYKL